ncbi:MAG: GNAT family N-acetyltransferase [Actinomycetota bacterium]|nr:GNAT family N-acetyltransferase [Actinomycetota bacterium]
MSVWIPPGGSDLSEQQEESLQPLLVRLLGRDAARVLRAFELIETAHPRDAPHYYLSLLGTDPARRGHGYGLGLLAANLRLIDDAGAPAYLESSNPANVSRYERHGFEVIGSLDLPEDGPTIHTMWRAPKPPVR